MANHGFIANTNHYNSLEKDVAWSLQAFMFEWSIKFIFLHETAHVIQLSCGADFSFEERYAMDAANENFSLKHHVYEIDADAYAGLILGREIGILWHSLPQKKQTDESLYRLYICALTTVFLVFLCLQNPYSEVYYAKGDHPHPFVRTGHILPGVLDGINRTMKHSKLNAADNVLGDTLTLTDIFLRQAGKPGFIMSAARIHKELLNITDYIEGIIYPEIDNFPALMVNQKQFKSN